MNETNRGIEFLHTTQMGLGAWQWGDRLQWGYGHGYGEADVHAVFQAAVEQNILFVDTAEAYGNGLSERLLGTYLNGSKPPIRVATKFFPWPWRLTSDSIPAALKASLRRLRLEQVDIYQIHWPSPIISIQKIKEGLTKCVEMGLARSVGVSNFGLTKMEQVYTALAQKNIPLASNQLHFSLLNRTVEKNGLLARCTELGIRLIAYSPLEMGLLTGKYSPEKPPPGPRSLQYRFRLPKIAPLIKLMYEIGQEYGGKTSSQVALNWVICKGALPIPGAKKPAQILENAGALGWKLSADEVHRLDEMSDQINPTET